MDQATTSKAEDRRRALVALGAVGAAGRNGMISGTTAARALGITLGEVRIQLRPFAQVTNSHRPHGPKLELYDPCEVVRLRDTGKVSYARTYLPKPPLDSAPTFATKYASRRVAVPDAVRGFADLHRYANDRQCPERLRAKIFALKRRFIEWLCQHGYLAGVHRLQVAQAVSENVCASCKARGCKHCKHTGRSSIREELVSCVLAFDFNGTRYYWSESRINAKLLPTHTPTFDAYESRHCKKGRFVRLSKTRIANTRALVEWVVGSP